MMPSRCLLFAFFLTTGLVPALNGQACPTVPEALRVLYEVEDEGLALISRIKKHCPGAKDSLSLVFHKRSVYAYNSEKNLETAIAYALHALEVQRELYTESPSLPLGKSLANLGLFYRLNGQYSLALPYLQEADTVFAALSNYYRRQNNHQQLVKLWHATGDLGQAEALLAVMLSESRSAQKETNNRATGLVAEAETLRLQGEQANQARNYAAGLPAFAAATEKFMALGDLASLLMTYMGEGRAYFHLGRYPEAREVTEKALALAKDYDLDYDKAVMYNLLALAYQEEGQLKEGRASLAAGEPYAQAYGGPEVLGTYANTSATLSEKEGDLAKALSDNAGGIAYLINDWTYSEETPVPASAQLSGSEYKQLVFEFLVERARLLAAADNPVAALEVVQAADILADMLRVDFGGQVSKLFWRREALPLYEFGIRLSQQQEDAERVFYFLERSRSILLLEALLQEDVRQMIGEELARQLAEADHDVKQQQRAVLITEGEALAAAQLGLLAANDHLAKLRERVANQYPATRQRLVMPELTSLAQAREQLAAGEWDRQIHFFYGEEAVYAFSLTATEALTYSLGSKEEIGGAVRQLLAFYTSPTAIDKDVQAYLALSHEAYEKLLGPLAIPPGERLLLLPDGVLAYLPFAALVTEPATASLNNATYLLQRNPISYAQSATVLSRQAAASGSAPQEAFAFAPFITELPNSTAAALPFTEDEVAGVDKHYQSVPLLGKEASRAALLEQADDFQILHLSTHAFAATDGTAPPRILTSTNSVYLADLYGLKLTADLVTLSACQSNIGPLARGEGVLGLGRAFTAAGAKGVVASLWSLNDRSTMEIVTELYNQLAVGKPKPMALHEAQLAYLSRSDIPGYLKSPYYWAGLTYYGDAGRLPARRWPTWAWGLMATSLFLSLYLLSRKLFRSQAGAKSIR